MSEQRFHLVCLGFQDSVANKNQLSLTLKDQLKLNDSQVADLMASRRTILARNLTEVKARQWAAKLARVGLNIEPETATANQKISADELRRHLLDGGLSHYFAGQYRHADDDVETRGSLLVLAAIPFTVYLILPLIALLLVLPLVSLSVWLSQPVAALTQLVIAGVLVLPCALFRPQRSEPCGLDLDPDTELLLFALTHEISIYLNAPSVTAIRITDAPFMAVRQDPLQWLTRRCELEIGLPYIQALTLQQFAGEITRQLGALAPPFTYWTWGAFRQWQQVLARLKPEWSQILMKRVAPIAEHLQARQAAMMQTLIGQQQALQVARLTRKLNKLGPLWPEFTEFYSTLAVSPQRWVEWLGATKAAPVADDESSEGQFRMSSPANWVLSNAAGYEKALRRDAGVPVAAETLLKQFQTYQKHQQKVCKTGVQIDALVPPTSTYSGNEVRPAQLMRDYAATRDTQRAAIAYALGLEKARPKQDLSALTQKWRSGSQGLWPKSAMSHPNLALGMALFSALQAAQQISLWAECEPSDSEAKELRERQLDRLYRNWHKAMLKLPEMPFGAPRGHQSLAQQMALPAPKQSMQFTPEVTGRWVKSLQIYWTLIAGSLLNSATEIEPEQAVA